ncbi:superoxide dismutase [Ni] [Vibrio sp. SCSIO 43137]|uniref:superoxide dismutase [Ni] n=1 Tax=Vibrio sp. SCSIO 43137 TaxID=3021011 RepID=UPI002306F6C9|nr:superoxide dismutase [Ni] [Vibrio sp. SCSIO 43137]WCE30924.1 superoxide dismutase [Ni] [Vibrio sp. SCSIO 43137]
MKKLANTILLLIGLLVLSPFALSHCQVPCGIYDDHARVQAMIEDAQITRKAVMEMSALEKQSGIQVTNQSVRWVMNKEQHAQKIISTISDYFLTQRVKASQKDYVERLKKHHAVIVAAMKVKQTADLNYVDKLEEAIKSLLPYYPEHKH